MKATLIKIINESNNIKTFRFEPKKIVDYSAGQFIELTLPHQADSRGEKRWFTLSSSPTEPHIALTTKFAKNGSSFKKQLLSLKPKDQVTMSEPMGDFILPINQKLPLVFIAGGVGITPFRSIVKYLTDTRQPRNIKLFYAVNNQRDIIFTKEFNKYIAEPNYIIKNAPTNWRGLNGELSAKLILKNVNKSSKTLFYVSGPEPMVKKLKSDLTNNNISAQKIVTDTFPGYKII
jgi:ferredoxin-NADP reductase